MKKKKLFVAAIILILAILAMAAYAVISGIAKKPVIDKHSFPFTITYELNGKTEIIEDVYEVSFTGHGGYIDMKERNYEGKYAGMQKEDDTVYVLSKSKDGMIILNPRFYADHMMGDSEYYIGEIFEPQLLYYDSQEVEYTDEQTLSEMGVKLISWEYPEPVVNSFVFSHIALMSSDSVLSLVLIGAVAFLAMLILVKKEKELSYKAIDRISIISNVIVGILTIPVTVIAMLIDINGSSEAWNYQMMYLMPAISLLGVAVSVALRRKGYGKESLVLSWIGPVLCAVIMFSSSF